MQNDACAFLELLQLADSALPIGAAAHSLGLEMLVAEEWLDVERLEGFLRDFLMESGALECTFCLRAHRLATRLTPANLSESLAEWIDLNAQLSAFKTARESRQASASLGRRFLQLVLGLEIHPFLPRFVQEAKTAAVETHHSLAFGLVSGLLHADPLDAGQAYLQQNLIGLISACQRLLPLGQSQASQILWHLHTTVVETVKRSADALTDDDALSCFTMLVELGSMRHPALTTRLFIS